MSSKGHPDATLRSALWITAAGGATLALGAAELALTLGLSDATSIGATTWRVAAVIVGAALAPTRAARALWLTAAGLAALMLLVMFTPLVERPALSLLRADQPAGSADVIVVFSGAMTDDGRIGDIALTRLVSALEDAQRLGIPHLLTSEQQRVVNGRQVTTGADQQRIVSLLGARVEPHSVSGVTNTYNESLAFAAYARTRNWSHVHAVTSPLHARRACETLEATGLRVTCMPATSRDVSFARVSTPGARLVVLRAALHEWVGYRVYKWRGWL